MTLEDFKDVYKDKTPIEKLKLMQFQHDYWRYDMKDRIDANWRGNFEEAQYYARECDAMRDRIVWLHEEISKSLKAQEPVKPYGMYSEHTGTKWLTCGACNQPMIKMTPDAIYPNYCPECGRKVWWE